MANFLPISNRTIWPDVSLSASCNRLCNFGDALQLLEVKLGSNAWPLVGKELPILEIQAYR